MCVGVSFLFCGVFFFFVYVFFFFFSVFFVFQAEDGIRDLVRSRGLGDVYKRQAFAQGLRVSLQAARQEDLGHRVEAGPVLGSREAVPLVGVEHVRDGDLLPVSYTHLTLPTSDLV